MAIQAVPVRNSSGYEWGVTRADPITGVQNYKVNTDLEEIAVFAPGLPQIGDPWEATGDLADLFCVQVGPAVRLGGKDTTGNGDGGHCRVPVLFEGLSGSSFNIPQDGRRWTELRLITGTKTVKFPLRRWRVENVPGVLPPPPAYSSPEYSGPLDPIENGDGCSVVATGIEARVHRYYSLGVQLDFSKSLQLSTPRPRVNAAQLSLPRINGFSNTWDLGPRQALYVGVEPPSVDGRFVKVTHVLQLADDWRFVWQPKRREGDVIRGLTYFDETYEAGDFDGLW